MPGELAKLFGRAFAIGFLLPAIALALIIFELLYEFRLAGSLVALVKEKETLAAVLALLSIWFGATTLLAINRPITRLLAGYGAFNPIRFRIGNLRKTHRSLRERVSAGPPSFDGQTIEEAEAGRKKYFDECLRLLRDYPDEELWILPTRFGNTLRAYEVYSRVVYGIEYTYVWSRLVAVIPSEYRDLIDNEKSQMDFWINVWFGSCFAAVIYLIMAAGTGLLPIPWFPLVAITVAVAAAAGARSAARSWGMFVMGSFDLYRGDLCRKLGLQLPDSVEKERQLWYSINQLWLYRSPQFHERLVEFRVAAAPNKNDDPLAD